MAKEQSHEQQQQQQQQQQQRSPTSADADDSDAVSDDDVADQDGMASNAGEPKEPYDRSTLERTLEGICKVTFAGMGGAIVGLAKEKEIGSSRMTQGRIAASAARARRASGFSAQNLPIAWAVSCGLFVSVVEVVRYASPTSRLLRALDQQEIRNPYKTTLPSALQYQTQAVVTVCDYSIGGAVAGIAGSAARKPYLPPTVPRSMLSRSRILLSGSLPGLTLGLIAGLAQAALDTTEALAATM